jgi:hypothetical protein
MTKYQKHENIFKKKKKKLSAKMGRVQQIAMCKKHISLSLSSFWGNYSFSP